MRDRGEEAPETPRSAEDSASACKSAADISSAAGSRQGASGATNSIGSVLAGSLGSQIAALVAGVAAGAFVVEPPRPWTHYKAPLVGGLLLLQSGGRLLGLVAWSRAGARSARLVGLALAAEVANVETLCAILSQAREHLQRREVSRCLVAPELAAGAPYAGEALARAGFEEREGQLCAILPKPNWRNPVARVALRTCCWIALVALFASAVRSLPEALVVAVALAPAVSAGALVEEWARRETLSFGAQAGLGCLLVLPFALAGTAQVAWSLGALESGGPLGGWSALGRALENPSGVWRPGFVWGGALVLSSLGPWATGCKRPAGVAGLGLALALVGALTAAAIGESYQVLVVTWGFVIAQSAIATLDRGVALAVEALWHSYLKRGLPVRYLRSPSI